ncbi:MAG: S24 family peptidase, partial [Desulfobacterales bacterium]|nr:S24 family peptidase [Desulfobacterales bacterium]
VLVVDKSVEAQHGHIVVAFVNGERLVKRLHCRNGKVALVAENPKYPPLIISEGVELTVWGVVVGKFKRMA